MVRRRRSARSAAWAVLAACIALQLHPAWIEPRLYWGKGVIRERRREKEREEMQEAHLLVTRLAQVRALSKKISWLFLILKQVLASESGLGGPSQMIP